MRRNTQADLKRNAILATVLALPFVATAADVRVPVTGSYALILPAPDGWRSSEQSGPVPTVSLTPASGNSFQILVSPLVAPGGATSPSNQPSLRRLVQSAADNARSQAEEASLPLQDFRSPTVEGIYFSATDRAPAPGEFKYLTQGAMSVQGLPVTFTILSNDDPRLVVEPALQMFRSARREATDTSTAARGRNDLDTERRLVLSSFTPGIALPKQDWILVREQHAVGGNAVYYMFTSEQRDMAFSVYIDKTNVCRSAQACLDAAMQNPQYKDAQALDRSVDGQFAVARFYLDQPNNLPLKQANVVASAYVNGLWFDVHISKAGAERPDMALLNELLMRLSIE